MKVFLSWSGERSRYVAEALDEWLRCVIQAVDPWISTRDLDRGSLWFGEISDQLKDTTVGIVCLTQENKDRPWILFEAGALAKGLSTSRVCTFLVDLQPKDIEDPLAQFNHTLPQRDSVLSLVRSLNAALGSSGLDEKVLLRVFDTYWPQFEAQFSVALEQTAPAAPSKPRPKEDVLSEILENTRSLNSRIRRIERQVELNQERDDAVSTASPGMSDVFEAAMRGVPIEHALEVFGREISPAAIRKVYRSLATAMPGRDG